MSTPQPETDVSKAVAVPPKAVSATPTAARDELKLTVPGVFALSGQPRSQYELHITRVAKDVLKEASNLATGKPEGSRKKRTEFHSDHVDRAFELIAERGLKRKARPGWYSWTRVAQGFFTLLTGAAAGLMALPDAHPFWGYCFVGSFAVTFLLLVVLEVADRSLAK